MRVIGKTMLSIHGNGISRSWSCILKLSLLVTIFLSAPVLAALHDRGNGLIYDDLLDVTWSSDVRLAKTLGYNPATNDFSAGENNGDDYLAHDEAMAFVYALNHSVFGSSGLVGYKGFTGWRLPRLHLSDAERVASTFTEENAAGVRNMGRDITDPRQELSHFYNISLGGQPSAQPPNDCQSNPDGGCIFSTANISLFINTSVLDISDEGLLASGYSSELGDSSRDALTSFFYEQISLLEDPENPGTYIPKPNRVFKFIGRQGYQDDTALTFASLGGGGRAWVVHDGDIGGGQVSKQVPLPLWLSWVLMASMLTIGSSLIRKNKR